MGAVASRLLLVLTGRVDEGGHDAHEQRRPLVDGAQNKLSFVDGTEVGSIVIEREGSAPATARGLRETDDLALDLTPATGC